MGTVWLYNQKKGLNIPRNTAHVKKLLQSNETLSNETSSEACQKQEELPVQQQEPSPTEAKAPLEEHVVAKPETPPRRSQRQSSAPSYLKDYFT